jgi:hypothetical protein
MLIYLDFFPPLLKVLVISWKTDETSREVLYMFPVV